MSGAAEVDPRPAGGPVQAVHGGARRPFRPITDVISVIIPCYNQRRFLAEAIESVLAQTYRQFEIVVVDDGSPESPADVLRAYPAVQYMAQPHRGVSAARNAGIRATRGHYLVFLDADDRLLPEHFEASLAAFVQHPDAGMVFGDYRWFGASDTWHCHTCQPDPDHYATLLRRHCIGPPLVAMLRREVVCRVGGFRDEFDGCEDLDLFLRIARAYPIHCHHRVVGEYRRHAEQSSQRWAHMLRTAVRVMQDQRAHVRRFREYEEPWRAGLRRHQEACGDPLLWHTVAAWRRGAILQAMRGSAQLLRYYPRGILRLFKRKLLGERRALQVGN